MFEGTVSEQFAVLYPDTRVLFFRQNEAREASYRYYTYDKYDTKKSRDVESFMQQCFDETDVKSLIKAARKAAEV